MNIWTWISEVWEDCYLFLISHDIAGYSLWSIMFSIFIVSTLVSALKLGTGSKKGD